MIPKAYKYWLFIFIFSLSGFTGLIYESVWSHYLKLFLGHAAYAQTLVIALFMGGMAVGSWFAAARTNKWKNLLLLYAVAEAIIGVFGLVFHQVFEFVMHVSHNSVLPGMEPGWVHAYKWITGAILISPQSFLLGTTFPLLSIGLLRRHSNNTGKTISLLYFSNSIGAAAGVLVAGFVLIRLVGLPGTILSAGVINILLAILVYLLIRFDTEPAGSQATLGGTSPLPLMFLLAAFLTGAASLIYEISWIRMLSMVLGSSTHSFELMLSAFILGLALGGFWIRKHIDTVSDPVSMAAGIQIIMGLLAICTIPMYNFTYDIMSVVLSALDRTETGYYFYSLTGHAICLFVMLPVTFCAGMTFPLFTAILYRNGYGERSVGYIYSANTLGAIAGVVFAIYAGLPVLGLKGSVLLGSCIDILLGFTLLMVLVKNITRPGILLNGLVCLGVLALTFHIAEIDQKRVISGVYRTGISMFPGASEILFYKDGKTSSISVTRQDNGNVVMATNGKPDASIIMEQDNDEPSLDEITMILLAAFPLSVNPDIKQVANIGMGSGLTTQVLLQWPGIEKVDTIEIEEAVVEGARHFLPRVARVYDDPRSEIHIEDARTFFSLQQKKYDLIVSEPSNPWVSGTSSLFTTEYYREIKRYLTPNGVLVQWLQIYELETVLLMSVIKALHEHFPYFDIYATDNSNIAIFASLNKNPKPHNSLIFSTEGIGDELSYVGLNTIQDFKSRYLGDEQILSAMVKNYDINSNSDYFPILDLNAERSRYLRKSAEDLMKYRTMPLPLINMLQPEFDNDSKTRVTGNSWHTFTYKSSRAIQIHTAMTGRNNGDLTEISKHAAATLHILKHPPENCSDKKFESLWINSVFELMKYTLPYLQPGEIKDLIEILKNTCIDQMSVAQLQWLVLFNALAERNTVVASQTADELINTAQDIHKRRFLFATFVLCAIVEGKHDAAITIWNEYINELFSNTVIPFEILLLQSLIKTS
ncbi:MAG: fused MFS/spermidine synthase [Thiotrichales bacterium]|nr:fused MFS/spermidine synthase [Thiotrichales bacterium]